MKRFVAFLFAFAMLCSVLCACGGETAATPVENDPPEETPQSVTYSDDEWDEEPDDFEDFDEADIFDPKEMSAAEIEEFLDYPEIMESWRSAHEFSPDYLDMQEVDSSAISEVGYSEIWDALGIRFRNTGKLYVYFGVSSDDVSGLYNADSMGKYFNEEIRDYYDFVEYDD